MRIGSLELQDDVSAADWIVDRIHGFAVDVGSVIPEGYDAYTRLFHPAIRIEDGREVPVRWSEIAAANDRTVHPEMQWANISGVRAHSGESSSGLWDLDPEVGSLPQRYADDLRELLAQSTSTPDRVWFGVWDGFGCLKVYAAGTGILTFGAPIPNRCKLPPRPQVNTFQLPNRTYYLLSGPVEGLGESMCVEPFWQSANLIWPEDRAWCLATEIDFVWTYVAGDSRLIEALTSDPTIEAMPTEIHHGVIYEADRINPPPAAPPL